MKILRILSLMIFIALSTQLAWAQNNVGALGQSLEENLFKTVKEANWTALESMTAPEFQSVNADKIRSNRTEAIEYIKSLRFNNYQFSNFNVTQNPAGNLIVVTYNVTYSETVGGQPQSGKLTKNLSVWEKINDKWMWVAHAVLD